MKDFGRWFADQKPPEEMLPDGVWENGAGEYFATCCCCERDTEIYCDISEIPETGYRHYCGGSQYCCP